MDKSRQQFEEALIRRKLSTEKKKNNKGVDDYKYSLIQMMWEGWQESRESLINSLEPVGYISKDGLNSLSENSDAITSSQQQYNKVIPLYKLD